MKAHLSLAYYLNLLFTITLTMLGTQLAFAAPAKETKSNSTPRNEKFVCPAALPELTSQLLQDLPSYSNRVIQRTQHLNQKAGISNYIITASIAELEPLDLPRFDYHQRDVVEPEQVFFTVRERQYIRQKVVDIKTYHWLFLAPAESGWRTVMLFSRLGKPQAQLTPTPPRESTDGIIGQGIQLWLRDCRAGSVRIRNK